MEPLGDQWSNVLLNGIFSNDDTEFMAQLLDNSPISNESSNVFSSAFWPTDDSVTPTQNDHGIPMFPLSDNINTNYNFSSSYSQDSYSSGENYYLNESTLQPSFFSFGLMNNSNRSSMSSMNFCFGENKPKEDLVMQGCGMNNNQSQAGAGAGAGAGPEAVVPLHAKHLRMMDPQFPLAQISGDNHNCYLMENSKKRPQVYSDHVIAQNQKKRNVKPKKSMNVKVNNNRYSSKTSSCGCSKGGDDDIDNNSSMNTMSQSQSQSQSHSEDVRYGKGKSSRGSASDPQSLYARKRREKINDRLKVLQNLVPNGTKVDISTMLEEAVQYVKFLQLQIKLLSSDEHWMYAPIAYNGMDIGLNMKFPMPSPTTT